MTVNKEFTRLKLKDVRKRLGITSAIFAEKAGISQSNYSGYETGKRPFGERILEDIASAHNISMDYLLYGKGEIFGYVPSQRMMNVRGQNVMQGGTNVVNTVNTSGHEKIIHPDGRVDIQPDGSQVIRLQAQVDSMEKEILLLQQRISDKENIINEKERLINILLNKNN